MVESKSKGKLKLKLEKLHFNYFTKKMRLENAVFYSDSSDQNTAYRFSIDKIELKAKAILPIIFRNEFLIDSISLLSPDITVTRIKPNPKPQTKQKEDVSIPEEMGKIYRSIQDAMSMLRIKRFEIEQGTFTLVNKITPDQIPLKISNIQFHIDNFQIDETKRTTDKILFSDNVVLNSNNQDIIFPDGRHRLSFARFNINLKKKLVEFDSCTIAATRSDSSAASFNVFFDALQLTNIDFDTLYKAEVIKADSVFCLNPMFNLEVELKKKGLGAPKLENIIEQLTGDLLLDHVVVSNAGFNIKTIRDGVPSSFEFSNNNFEMQGLRVEQESVKPVTVSSFSMAIRNYENFIKDSLYSVRFDSVVFKDDKITLSHFLFNKLDNGKVVNTFSIPQFNLTGLSWDDLVFENKLRADQAIMFNPYINYTASSKMLKKGSKNVFQSLGALNEYMDLQQLDIMNGTIDLKFRNHLRVQLNDATLSVKSHSLLESKKLAGIKNSLLFLRFGKGVIHAGNLDLEIHDIDYEGNSGAFAAGNIQVMHKGKRTMLEDVKVKKLVVNELTGNLFADGVVWNKATIRTDAFGGGEGQSSVNIKNVQGKNTTLSGPVNGNPVSANIDEISFAELDKTPGKKIKLEGLFIKGNTLKYNDGATNIDIGSFNLKDHSSSSLNQVRFSSPNTLVTIPVLSMQPDVGALLDGKLNLGQVNAIKPKINIHVDRNTDSTTGKKSSFPPVSIAGMRLNQPLLDYSVKKDSIDIHVKWEGEKNPDDFAEVKNLTVNGNITQVDQLNFSLSDFNYNDSKGKTFTTGNGKLSARLKNIEVEAIPNNQAEWQATVSSFTARDFSMDSIGNHKRNFHLSSGSLENLDISSSLILNMQKLVAANSTFGMKGLTGNFSDRNSHWDWHNLSFNRGNNSLHLDSFSIHPLLGKDSFMAIQPFETDYMDFTFGELNAGPVNLEKYIKDNTLDISKIDLHDFIFVDYRDKRLPDKTGTVKPLPVNLLRAIGQKMKIDTLVLHNATVHYSELSQKTGLEGAIPVKRMNVTFIGLKNYELDPRDSLFIDATGYLLDTAWIRLTVNESYGDTLGGFLMTVDMKPVDATIFNSVLIPLEGVKIVSGYADTLTMYAIAREYMAIGKMQLFYDNLKIKFPPAPGKKENFWYKLKNFIANTFIIKDRNRSRTSIVFFIRDRERSAISYIVKTALAGVGNSITSTSDRKLIRRYKKVLKSKNLPATDFDKK
jgi:hypothetical protein